MERALDGAPNTRLKKHFSVSFSNQWVMGAIILKFQGDTFELTPRSTVCGHTIASILSL